MKEDIKKGIFKAFALGVTSAFVGLTFTFGCIMGYELYFKVM